MTWQEREVVMEKVNKEVILYYHPDELFDRPYEQVILDRSHYQSIQSKYTNWVEQENSVVLSFEDGKELHIQFYNEEVIRISAFPCQGPIKEKVDLLLKQEKVPVSYNCVEESTSIHIENEAFKIIFDKQTKNITLYNRLGELLLETCAGGILFSDEQPEYSGYRSLCHFKINDEAFYGFGGRTMHPNRRGTTVDIFNIKAGVRKGDYGGCALPFFMSTKGYGFFLNNPWPHVYFDMGKTKEDEWFFNTPGGSCDIFVIAGPEFSDIIGNYTRMTGRMPIPPKWLFGFWASSLTIKNSEEVLDMARKFRELEIPCDGLLIDAEWRVGPGFLEQYTGGTRYKSNDVNWHPEFGDKKELIDTLKSLGYKLGLHLNSRNFSSDTENYGVEKQYIRQHNEESYIDFMNEEAKAFYEELISQRVEEDVDLWWVDHSDRVSGEIAPGIPCRNLLGIYWSEYLTELMQKYSKPNILSLTRGSGIGGQKYGFPWPGDTSNGIEFFEEDLWYCMNVGLGGFPISSVDLGGFNLKHLFYGKMPPEYYKDEQDVYNEVFDLDNILRRVCQSLICIPVIRLHNNWCTLPKFPWHCEEKVEETYRAFLEERYQLTPYIYSAAIYGARTGQPVLKPLVYAYRQDQNVHNIGDECLLGEDLLVAPITKAKVISRTVYLPEGKWFYMWEEESFTGPCTLEIEAPLYTLKGLPIFIKEGSIIPRQPVVQYLEDAPSSSLTLDYYMTHKAQLCLYESEEITNHFTGNIEEGRLHLSLENTTSYERYYTARLHQSRFNQLVDCKNCKVERIEQTESDIVIIVLKVEAESCAYLILKEK